MNPVYFPFVHISEGVFSALSAVFDQVILYQPAKIDPPASIQAWQKAGKLERRIPVQGDEAELARLFQDYREWALLHGGRASGRFRASSKTPPFWDEEGTSRLRSRIRSRESSAASEDPLTEARLFLFLTLNLDFSQEAVQTDLRALQEKEARLLDALSGTAPDHSASPAPLSYARDPGIVLPDHRLAAWSRLMAVDPAPSGIFLTSSPVVYDAVLARAPEARRVRIGPDGEDPGTEGFAARLAQLVSHPLESETLRVPRPETTGGAIPELVLHLVPNISPVSFFSRFLATGTGSKKSKQSVPVQNTLLGQIRISTDLGIY